MGGAEMKKIRLVVIISLILMAKSFLYTQEITNKNKEKTLKSSINALQQMIIITSLFFVIFT